MEAASLGILSRVLPESQRRINQGRAIHFRMTIISVAVVQAEVVPLYRAKADDTHETAEEQRDSAADAVEAIVSRTATLARQARDGGASIVVFPETWIPGYPIWLDVCRDVALWDHAPVKRVFTRYANASMDVSSGALREAISEIARSLGITLVIGVSEKVSAGRGRGTLYNSLLTFGPDGALLNHHRKLMPTYTERMVWGQGDANGLGAVETPSGRVGGLICWEHWMPLARQAMHESGEDIHIAVWPTVHEMHQVASRQYAFEGRCFVLAAGSLMSARDLPQELEVHSERVVGDEAWVMRGGSAIIAPDGRYLAGPVFEELCILHATLDLDEVRAESMSLDVSGHYARPDCLELAVKRNSARN